MWPCWGGRRGPWACTEGWEIPARYTWAHRNAQPGVCSPAPPKGLDSPFFWRCPCEVLEFTPVNERVDSLKQVCAFPCKVDLSWQWRDDVIKFVKRVTLDMPSNFWGSYLNALPWSFWQCLVEVHLYSTMQRYWELKKCNSSENMSQGPCVNPTSLCRQCIFIKLASSYQHMM